MPLQNWTELEYAWVNIVLISLFALNFIILALFKLRKGFVKTYFISLIIGAIITLVGTQIVGFVSPTVNHMYFKYETNSQIMWLTQSGWEIVDHYGEKKIVHVKGG